VRCLPDGRAALLDGKAMYTHHLPMQPGESRGITLLAAYATKQASAHEHLLYADPMVLIEETRAYYDSLIAPYSIQAPSPILQAAFLASLWNLDSVYNGQAWLEGAHWWSAPWTNLFQISAAISLGQGQRARNAFEFFDRCGYDPVSASFDEVPGYDGILYYLHELFQYYDATGDQALFERIWSRLETTLERLLATRDLDGDGLLDWHLHCNAYLYQADHLGMPGAAASPSLMAAGMLERLASLANELEKPEQASRWEAISQKLYAELPRLWNARAGAFYGHIDLQGLRHEAHYYTDLVYPTLYTHLSPEQGCLSLAHLARTLLFESGVQTHPPSSLMRVGDYLPTIFGNNNVMPTQMAEAARAFFQAGDGETGTRLLEGVAWAATLHTEAPGCFPEHMSPQGKGEANYLFGNPTGSYAYAVASGLFGLALVERGQTLSWRPGFPQDWDQAALKLPYAQVAYHQALENGFLTRTYRAEAKGKSLSFVAYLPPCKLHSVTCNGEPVEYHLSPGLGKTRLSLAAQDQEAYEIAIRFIVLGMPVKGPACCLQGEQSAWQLPLPPLHVDDQQGLLAEMQVHGNEITGTINAPPGDYLLLARLEDPCLVLPVQVSVLHPAPTPAEDPQSLARRAQDMHLTHLDLSPFYNSRFIFATSAWRSLEVEPDLASLREVSGLVSAGGSQFLVPPDGLFLALAEYGRSHPDTRLTQRSAFPSRLEIPVGQHASLLALLYITETESRHTGSRVGCLRLRYATGEQTDVPLVVGKNVDTLWSSFAQDTIPVRLGESDDYANVLWLACDRYLSLEAIVIELDVPDVQLGLLGLNRYSEDAPFPKSQNQSASQPPE
jgi:hypothetical protein